MKASCDLFFCTNELNKATSFLGDVKYKYISCNIVSASFMLLLPFTPSEVLVNTGLAAADLPAKSFCRSSGENFPTPIVPTTAVA